MKIKTSTLIMLVALATTPLIAQDAAAPKPNNTASSTGQTAQLPPVVVTGAAPYVQDDATTATKTDIPIKDLPASVQVVPKDVLDDRGVTQISQIADTVSGVHPESSYGSNGGTFFNVRGFSTANTLRDGFRTEGNLQTRDVQDIGSIEVLKGPSGALYSTMGSLGGFINVMSKRPLEGTFGELGITAGSYGLLRPTLDFNTPLNADGSVLGRLNASYEYNDTFRDFGGYHSFAIAPAITWKIDSDTKLTFLGEFDSLHQNHFDYGVFNDPATLALSRSTYYGLPNYDSGRNDTYNATLLFEHKINSNWTWRESANFNYVHQDSTSTFPIALNGSPALSYLTPYNAYISPSDVSEFSRDYSLQSDLEGKFSTGGIKHTLLAGIDLVSYTRGGDPFYQALGTLNVLHPDYNAKYDPSTRTLYDVYDNTVRDLGFYVQDLIELSDKWKIFAGLRGDWNQDKLTPHMSGDSSLDNSSFSLSPRAGIVFQPGKDTSLYFSWGRSSVTIAQSVTGVPGSLLTASGVPVNGYKPEIANQLEAGVKQELLGGKVTSTLAAYQITRSNALTQDPSNVNDQIQVGEQRSRGIEFDTAGQLAPGWKLIATYAFCDAVVTKDNTLSVGDRLANAPKNSGSFWSTYQFQDGSLKGLGVGAGVVYVGEREAMLPNSFMLDSYWRTDASLFYQREKWKAQVNFLNVFDTKYFTGGTTGTYNQFVRPGQPFGVQATITCKF